MGESSRPRNILITGAAGALGGAVAKACAALGAQVMLIDRVPRGLERICEEIESAGGNAPGYCQLDLATAGPAEITDLLGQLRDAYGPLDSLVHCAARFHALQPLEQVTPSEWLQTLQVNLNAAWLLSMACLPDLRQRAGTSLLFTLDGSASVGRAYWGAYGVSKGALRVMAATLAEELDGSGCRVHGVDPGPLRSALRATAYHAENPATVQDPSGPGQWIAAIAMGRLTPDNVLLEYPGE